MFSGGIERDQWHEMGVFYELVQKVEMSITYDNGGFILGIISRFGELHSTGCCRNWFDFLLLFFFSYIYICSLLYLLL